MNKPIRLTRHAQQRAAQRGATESEIRETIRTSQWQSASPGRWLAKKRFAFNAISPVNQQFYLYKIIEPVFVEEVNEIVVVTVKVYYAR